MPDLPASSSCSSYFLLSQIPSHTTPLSHCPSYQPITTSTTMANLPTSFIITLNGTPIAKNINPDEEQIHAEADHNNPAVFTFSNGLLESDGWYLGRSVIEDRSLLPKRVLWHKKGGEVGEDLIQKTTIEDQGGNLVLTNGGTVLTLIDGQVYGDLIRSKWFTICPYCDIGMKVLIPTDCVYRKPCYCGYSSCLGYEWVGSLGIFYMTII
ncbi:unnamed protein product [Aspergillus oryzae RIB40]|uniref:DNA, SC011 n=1 Tax=Aspergillus oryzae (strain ATCC 42149 / RIB 40) TaxID=510516 RepID=Q2U174_ASPOR|nr:unnamed protein product [Aspergillus oryzae RIB40]BAE64691.1 unnamed protein product [Aspergillus oryzae RIB40]